MDRFSDKYGPVALVTGGSEGVGASYSRFLAERGLDLVLVSRHKEVLDQTRDALAAEFPARSVTSVVTDLTDPATPAMLAEHTRGQEIGLLVYNAG